MTDTLSPSERSERMSRIKGRDTKPEMLVRRMLHAMGYRYRLHAKDLPGRPDVVFRSRKKAVFIHGCFWHRHPGCKMTRMPKSRLNFWRSKLEGNRKRDIRNQKALSLMGWKVLVVWECETRDTAELARRLRVFMGSDGEKHTNDERR